MYFKKLVKEEPVINTTEFGMISSKISAARISVYSKV